MQQTEIGNETYQASPPISIFVELLKSLNEDTASIETVINEFQIFLTAWEDFKRSKREPVFHSEYFKRFYLFHTIKPKTQYAHQQEYIGKNPKYYTVHRIENNTVHSTAPGGNYPLHECNIYISDGHSIVPLQPTKK